MSGDQDHGQEAIHSLIDWRFLAALLGLAINDHWAKSAYPGLITGKFSDLAGMIVLPIILSAVYALVRGQSTTQPSTKHISLLISGLFLTAIKTVPFAASQVEDLLRTITGSPQQIVVDPTDLVGLAALAIAHRVLRQPQPIPVQMLGRVGPKLALGFGILLITATSNEPDYGWTRLEVEGDQVIATVVESYRDPISSVDGGRTWDPYPVDVDSSEGEQDSGQESQGPERGPICLSAQPDTCIRLTLGAIQESNDGGKSWIVKWDINTEEYWATDALGYDADITASDMLILGDDTVVVAVGAHQPVRRDAQSGLWTPSIADIRTVPWDLILVAFLFQLPIIGGIRRFRGGHDRGLLYLLGAPAAGAAGLLAAVDTVGPGIAVGVPTAGVITTTMVVGWMSETRDPGSHPALFSAPLGPVTALLVFATTIPFLAWAQDRLDWAIATKLTWAIAIAGPIIVGFVGRPTVLASKVPGQPPAPNSPLAASIDQPPPPGPSPEPATVWSNRSRTSVGFRLAFLVTVFALLVDTLSGVISSWFGLYTLTGLSLMVIVLGLVLLAVAAIAKSGRQHPSSMSLRLWVVALLFLPVLFPYQIPPLGDLIYPLVLVVGVPLTILGGQDRDNSNGTRSDVRPQPDPTGPPSPPGRDQQLHQ